MAYARKNFGPLAIPYRDIYRLKERKLPFLVNEKEGGFIRNYRWKSNKTNYSKTSLMGLPVAPLGNEIPSKAEIVGAISEISVL